jgi:hypothetical protein
MIGRRSEKILNVRHAFGLYVMKNTRLSGVPPPQPAMPGWNFD